MVALEFVVLKLVAFLRKVCHGVTTRHHKGCIQQACEGSGTLVSLRRRYLDSTGGVRDCARAELFQRGFVSRFACFDSKLQSQF